MAKFMTREIKTTFANALVLNTETAEPYNKEIVIPGEVTDKKKALRKVKAMVDNETDVVVKIVDLTPQTGLRGMTEEFFIANSIELDPATRKPYKKEN